MTEEVTSKMTSTLETLPSWSRIVLVSVLLSFVTPLAANAEFDYSCEKGFDSIGGKSSSEN